MARLPSGVGAGVVRYGTSQDAKQRLAVTPYLSHPLASFGRSHEFAGIVQPNRTDVLPNRSCSHTRPSSLQQAHYMRTPTRLQDKSEASIWPHNYTRSKDATRGSWPYY